MKILITGCGGFVGGSVAAYACAHGHQTYGLGRSAQPPVTLKGEYLSIDVATARLSPIIKTFAPDVIVHAAGSASVGRSFESPLDDLRASVLTFANLLDGVRESQLRPLVVFPSSAAVYGNPSSLPVPEDASLRPISPYGFHKLSCEILAREYQACYGFSIVTARLFSLFGREQRRLLLWELVQKVLSDEPDLVIHGTGKETRDYLAVAECMRRLFRIMENPSLRDCLTAVNLASGLETSVEQLASDVMKALGRVKPIRTADSSPLGDPVRWRADTTFLEQLAGPLSPPELHSSIAECALEWKSEFSRASPH